MNKGKHVIHKVHSHHVYYENTHAEDGV